MSSNYIIVNFSLLLTGPTLSLALGLVLGTAVVTGVFETAAFWLVLEVLPFSTLFASVVFSLYTHALLMSSKHNTACIARDILFVVQTHQCKVKKSYFATDRFDTWHIWSSSDIELSSRYRSSPLCKKSNKTAPSACKSTWYTDKYFINTIYVNIITWNCLFLWLQVKNNYEMKQDKAWLMRVLDKDRCEKYTG